MNLIHEYDGAGAELPRLFGIGHNVLDFLYGAEHGGRFAELGTRAAGDDLRQSGFANSRRTPKNDGTGIITVDLEAQRFAGSEDVLLAHEFFQRSRTHAISQRSVRI